MYPYFHIGYELEMSLDAISNLTTLFKRMSFEEAISAPERNKFKASYIICGRPFSENPNTFEDIIRSYPIKLNEFKQEYNGKLPSHCDLQRVAEIKVFINGQEIKLLEDYTLDIKENSIRIMWDLIDSSDVFSYLIPVKLG